MEAVVDLACTPGTKQRPSSWGCRCRWTARIGPQAQAVQSFCEGPPSDACPLPIHTVNEQYTSAEAEQRLRDVGVEPSRDRARVDALAAAIILQEWLDAGQ